MASIAVRRPSTSPQEWRKGLILGHNHIGDVLYRTCSLSALKQNLPDCSWDYLAGPVSADVLRGNPAINTILPDQIGDDSWSLRPGILAGLRERHYDVVLCTNVLRYYPDLLIALRLGVANRVGFTLKGFSGLVTFPVESGFPQPYPAYFRNMVAAVTRTSPSWPLVPRIFPSAGDEIAATRAWSELALSGKPVVAASLTTRQPGAWPREHYLRALEIVHRVSAAQIVLFGGPDELALLGQAAMECEAPCIVLDAGLNLRALGVFLSQCSAVLTADSGPRHLANAVGVPVVFGRNLIFRRVEAGTYCDNEIDVASDDELVPAELVRDIVMRLDPARTARQVIKAMQRRDS